MLTREDLKYNFLFLKWVSNLQIYPIHFDDLTGKMRLRSSFSSKLSFKCSQLCIFAHAVHALVKTTNSVYTSGFDFTVTPIQIIASVAFLLGSFGVPSILLGSWPELFVKLCNEFHSVHVHSHMKDNGKRNWDSEDQENDGEGTPGKYLFHTFFIFT